MPSYPNAPKAAGEALATELGFSRCCHHWYAAPAASGLGINLFLAAGYFGGFTVMP